MNQTIFHISSNYTPSLPQQGSSSYRFFHFDSCKEAQKQGLILQPQIVITDWFVADCQGWLLLQEFHKLDQNITSVLLVPSLTKLALPTLPEHTYIWRTPFEPSFFKFLELIVLNHSIRLQQENGPILPQQGSSSSSPTLYAPFNQRNTAKSELNDSLQNIQNAHILQAVRQGLLSLKDTLPNSQTNTFSQLIRLIDSGVQANQYWQIFQDNFQQVHVDFFAMLKKRHPELTAHELRLCAMIRLNLSNDDIATVLGVAPKSINVAKYRLRKKMKINASDEFLQILLAI